MFKNTASQKIAVFAFDATTGLPKSGDAANITAYVSKDWGTVTVLGDTSATEMDATNAKGWYLFDLTQAETNADALLFSGKSSTSNISVVGCLVFTTPANFSAFSVDSSGRVDVAKIKGTASAGTAGYVGIDWSVVLNSDSIVSLSATTVATVTNLTGKTGFSLATTQTFNNTGTWTGNLVGTVSTVTTNTDMITAAQIRTAVGLATANLDTQLSNIGTSSTIATAVWAKDLSAPATAGTAADYLKDAAAMTDQWFTMTALNAGNYRFTAAALALASGSGATAADIWAYATRTLTTIGVTTFTGPVIGTGQLSIMQGDTYNADYGNAISKTFSGFPDLTTADSITFNVERGDADSRLSVDCVDITSTTLKIELTSAQTRELNPTPLVGGPLYNYRIVAHFGTDGEDHVTLESGTMAVTKDAE